jgi:NADPH-dependent 2,4-dienoyl-CoA reductase/sulfur reductase-like enzyme
MTGTIQESRIEEEVQAPINQRLPRVVIIGGGFAGLAAAKAEQVAISEGRTR